MLKIYNITRARQDRNDEKKTYWDNIGTLFEDGDKRWMRLNWLPDTFQVFPLKAKDDRPNQGNATEPDDIPFG